MANPALGHKSYLQIGKQTTYDTPVAATQKLELITEGIEIKPGYIDDPSLYNAQSRRALIEGGLHAEGSAKFRANYDGFLELFRGTLGGYSNSVVETGVRSHVFVEGTNPNLSLQIGKGDIPVGKVHRVTGAKVRQFSLDLPANGMGTFEFDFIGKDLETDVTPTGALSFPAVLPALYKQGSIVDGTADIAGDIRVRNLKLTYTIPLTDDRFYIGAANMDEPLGNDFVGAEWEIQQEFKTKAAFDKARGFTDGTVSIQLLHPATIGTVNNRSLTFRSTACRLVGYSNPVAGYGVLIATARWRSYFASADSGSLYINAINTEAALT